MRSSPWPPIPEPADRWSDAPCVITCRLMPSVFLPMIALGVWRRQAAWGPRCVQLIERLLCDRIVERLRAAQGVLGLQKRYSAARLEAACERALLHDSPHYRTVKSILAGGHDLRLDAVIAADSVPHTGRFARDAASLLAAPPGVQ
jgi:hypothetical protein